MTGQRISISQSQRLALTAGLATSIEVLRMDAGGLTRFLQEQAAANPFLAVEPPPLTPWLPRWTQAFGASLPDGRPEAQAPGPSLIAHVMAQIDGLLRSRRERQIALVLAEALEPSGWLGQPWEALVRQTRSAAGDAEAVLARLQTMEPTGLFARNLGECLRLQAQEAGHLDTVMSCMIDHLDMLAARDFAALARLCNVPEVQIVARLRLIRGYDPKPGARFDPGAADAREPDLVVTTTEAGLLVTLNRSSLPTLAVRRPATRPEAEAERRALASALGLARMVERRNATLLRVAREILARQTAALTGGLGALVPLTLADVAAALDLHPSTVGRVVAGAAVATPQGTWMLRHLVVGKVGDASAAAIRAAIDRLVAAEDPARPLTDDALAAALGLAGLPVARRTVAKYREMLGIPIAGARRRHARRRRAAAPDVALGADTGLGRP